MKSCNKKKGFTLIELLVVIAIIGILSSIVLVSMGSSRAKAKDAVRKAAMRQLVSAQEMYYAENDVYYASSTYPVAIGTYMVRTPIDPTNSGSYVYKTLDNTGAGNNQYFCYWATMEKEPASCAFYTACHAGNVCKTAAPTSLADCAEAD